MKVIQFLGEEREIFTKYGKKTKRDSVVADDTGCKKITFWQRCINEVEPNKYYKITNITTHYFKEEMWINTTSKTTITEIPTFGEVVDSTQLIEKDSKNIAIEQISVLNNKRCSNIKCNKTIKLPSDYVDSTVKCQTCSMKQKVSKMKEEIVATINTENGDTYMVYQDKLKEYLQSKNKEDLMTDIDRLEDHMLQIENFQIETNNNSNVITSIIEQM